MTFVRHPQWQNLCHKCVDTHTAGKGEDFHVPSGKRHIERGVSVRQTLWEAHTHKSTVALEEARKRTEDETGRAQCSVTGGSET